MIGAAGVDDSRGKVIPTRNIPRGQSPMDLLTNPGYNWSSDNPGPE